MTRARRFVLLTMVLVLVGCAVITRGSVTSAGDDGDGSSFQPVLSGDGRFLVYTTASSNLTPGDFDGTTDVVIRDQQSGLVELVSAGANGNANGPSDEPAVSADGRYVVFRSYASNLVPADDNNAPDVFLRDRNTGTTTRVSVGPAGVEADDASDTPAISPDGGTVAFASAATNLVSGDTNGSWDVFVTTPAGGAPTLVSRASGGTIGNGDSGFPALSSAGGAVAFRSSATNLVSGDTNSVADIFVRDRTAGTTARVSVATSGTQTGGASGHPSISADARYVAFDAVATNLVSGDTNGVSDVFVRDRTAATTTAVSLTASGSTGNGASQGSAISDDGRFVAFSSRASNLIAGDTNGTLDAFVRDRISAATSRVSVTTIGGEGQGPSGGAPSVSHDGRYVAFQSGAPNLVDRDTNGQDDVFTRFILAPRIDSVSPASIARGGSATLVVTGSGFLPGASIFGLGDGVTVGATTRVSDTRLQATVTVASAAPIGSRAVWVLVSGSGGSSGQVGLGICGCFSIG